jgi:L-histidine N-alpha-methyltransferase
VRAYDDAAGVTAAFNLNVLNVLNRELEADFDAAAWRHVALWNADREWIEMRLRVERPQRVELPRAGVAIDFRAGDEIRTEISAKFTRERIERELVAAGLRVELMLTDTGGRFAVTLAAPAPG